MTEKTAVITNDGKQRPNAASTAPPTGKKKAILTVLMVMTELCSAIMYSILSPFYPRVAAAKGLNAAGSGLVMGILELCSALFSPLYGKALSHIGSRFLYISGALCGGVSCILFGFVEDAADGVTFVTLCIVIRAFQGTTIAAYVTATYTILSDAFPENVAAIFGLLETMNTIGFMIGPPLGGFLYESLGFKAPFALVGVLLIMTSLCAAALLPKPAPIRECPEPGIPMTRLLTQPIAAIMLYITAVGAAAIGVQNATLSLFLQDEFQLNTSMTGLMFLAGPVIYALATPLWGRLGDTKPHWGHTCIIVGFIVCGVAHFFLGPAPFLHIPRRQLWLVIVSLAVFGLGLSPMVLAFPDILHSAVSLGYPASQATNGIVSGLFNGAYHFGGFVGPFAGGALLDTLGFAWAMVVCGLVVAASGALLIFYEIGERLWYNKGGKEKDEKTPLLRSRDKTENESHMLTA